MENQTRKTVLISTWIIFFIFIIIAPVYSAETNTIETRSYELSDDKKEEAYISLDSFFTLYQPYVANISAYEPIYFLVGTEPKNSKFQIGFRYRFINPKGSLSEKFPWIKGFHLGYTQTSFWDLSSNSAPFEDTSYKPELFFLSSNSKTRPFWIQGLFFQLGLQHESNGRGGDFSRSTNFAYIKPIFIFYDQQSKWGMQVAPKFWAYVKNQDETNGDLDKYRGYFELETKVGKADSFVLGSYIRYAKKGFSLQVDLTYPLHALLDYNFDLYFQAQYTNALAESLIHYKRRIEALRLGFSIVR